MFKIGARVWYLDTYGDVYYASVTAYNAGKTLVRVTGSTIDPQWIPDGDLYSVNDKLARLLYG